jgi:RNase adaptor protein for sRNA GlmZ degradation
MSLIHATCVMLDGCGILIRGESGCGKSGLALRLINEAGAVLVADDQTRLRCGADGAVRARAPATLRGRIEARGLGFLDLPTAGEVAVALVVDLPARGAAAQRLPDPPTARLLGRDLPRAALAPDDPAAVAKLCLALTDASHDLQWQQLETPTESGEAMNTVDETAPAASGSRAGEAGERLPVVLVTGMSGAGRSTTLKILEDLGYEAIDNLPLHLLPRIVRDGGLAGPLAVGVDIRTRNFSVTPFLEALRELRADPGLAITLLFLDSENDVLRKRFTETRRRHPLAQERPVADGIDVERRLVAPLLDEADLQIDTSSLTVHDLRQVIASQLAPGDAPGMVVFVTSFAYKAGVPREADLVFDARFLRNPHYDPALRPKTGQDDEVRSHVTADPDYRPFFDGLTGILTTLMPRYAAEGKSYLTIAIGCSGGRHRSVAVGEALAAFLREGGWRVIVSHRELGLRGAAVDGAQAS